MTTDKKPTHIVCLGDLFDMPSLCNHDKDKANFKLRSYQDDVDSGVEALEAFGNVLRRAKFEAEMYFLLGNHEQRIERFLAEDERFKGTISYDDFQLDELKWEMVPFLDVLTLEGVHFSHYFPGGLKGKPVGGENPATSLLKTQMVSCVAGHSHLYDYSERTRGDKVKISGLVAGCFLEPGQREGYAGPSQKMWRNGVTLLNNVQKGMYDLEFWSVERLQDVYR